MVLNSAQKAALNIALAEAPGIFKTPAQAAADENQAQQAVAGLKYYPTVNAATGILLPLYISLTGVYTNTALNSVLDLKRQYHNVPLYVVLNPSSGPGTAVDANYSGAVKRLQSVGAKVLAYVRTTTAARSLITVQRDIDTWKRLYPTIDGLFVDEQSVVPAAASYYVSVTKYAHDRGLFPVVGNPAATVPSAYLANPVADVQVVYQGSTYPAEATLKGDTAGGYSDYPTVQRAAVVTGQTFDATNVAMMAKYTSMLYVTSDVDPTPFDTVSPLLAQLFTALGGTSGSAATTIANVTGLQAALDAKQDEDISFKPGAAYVANQQVLYNGGLWTAKVNFTAGGAFSSADWNAISSSIADGSVGIEKLSGSIFSALSSNSSVLQPVSLSLAPGKSTEYIATINFDTDANPGVSNIYRVVAPAAATVVTIVMGNVPAAGVNPLQQRSVSVHLVNNSAGGTDWVVSNAYVPLGPEISQVPDERNLITIVAFEGTILAGLDFIVAQQLISQKIAAASDAFWRMDDAVGSTAVKDQSGNGLDGTLVGVAGTDYILAVPGLVSSEPTKTAIRFRAGPGYVKWGDGATIYNLFDPHDYWLWFAIMRSSTAAAPDTPAAATVAEVSRTFFMASQIQAGTYDQIPTLQIGVNNASPYVNTRTVYRCSDNVDHGVSAALPAAMTGGVVLLANRWDPSGNGVSTPTQYAFDSSDTTGTFTGMMNTFVGSAATSTVTHGTDTTAGAARLVKRNATHRINGGAIGTFFRNNAAGAVSFAGEMQFVTVIRGDGASGTTAQVAAYLDSIYQAVK